MTDSTPASNRKPADQLADIRELRDQERVLRTGGARHLLAELFHPGDLPLTDQRVVTRRNPDFGRMLRQLGAAVTYRKAIAGAEGGPYAR
jgi:hypothetical protein